MQKYDNLDATIKSVHLSEVHNMKPLVSGNQLCQEYNIKPGRIMKPLLEEVIKFQIINPLAKEDDVKVYMEAHKENFLAKHS